MKNIKFEIGAVVTFMSASGIPVVGLVNETIFEHDVTVTLEKAVVIQSDGKNLAFSQICAQNLDKIQKFYISALLTEPGAVDEGLEVAYLEAIGIKKIVTPESKIQLV